MKKGSLSGSNILVIVLLVLAVGATLLSFYRYKILENMTFFTEGFSIEEE